MRALAWNCRGACRSPTIRAISELIRESCPDLVFLSETKLKSDGIDKIKTKLNFFDSYCVDAMGKAGGLALFWRMGVDLEVVFSDGNVIAALIYLDPVRSPWLLFCIYGPPRRAKRKRFWVKLEEMVKAFSGPWAVFGDFNSTKESGEKKKEDPMSLRVQ